MRALFTSVAATGHVHPLVPFARALADAGHDVAFATHADMAPLVERAGFQHRPAGISLSSPEVTAVAAALGTLPAPEHNAYVARHGFAGVVATRMAADLTDVLDAWPADVIVRDSTELAGCIVAERRGLPHAAVSILAAGPQLEVPAWIAEPLNALRALNGLAPDPELAMLSRYLTFHPFPPSLLDPSLPSPSATTQFVQAPPFDRSGDEDLPAWIDHLPDRPLVYVTLGTVFNGRAEVFEAFLAGLRDEPVNAIVTVGRDQDPAQFGPQPPHIRIERYVPQSRLFPRCDLVLTHGGSGTMMAALTHGLPLVIVPIAADQPENAKRCAALGLGRVIEPQDLTPESVRGAVRAVLGNPGYRANVERLRQELRSLPGMEYAVSLLEQLADRPAPGGRGRAAVLVGR